MKNPLSLKSRYSSEAMNLHGSFNFKSPNETIMTRHGRKRSLNSNSRSRRVSEKLGQNRQGSSKKHRAYLRSKQSRLRWNLSKHHNRTVSMIEAIPSPYPPNLMATLHNYSTVFSHSEIMKLFENTKLKVPKKPVKIPRPAGNGNHISRHLLNKIKKLKLVTNSFFKNSAFPGKRKRTQKHQKHVYSQTPDNLTRPAFLEEGLRNKRASGSLKLIKKDKGIQQSAGAEYEISSLMKEIEEDTTTISLAFCTKNWKIICQILEFSFIGLAYLNSFFSILQLLVYVQKNSFSILAEAEEREKVASKIIFILFRAVDNEARLMRGSFKRVFSLFTENLQYIRVQFGFLFHNKILKAIQLLLSELCSNTPFWDEGVHNDILCSFLKLLNDYLFESEQLSEAVYQSQEIQMLFNPWVEGVSFKHITIRMFKIARGRNCFMTNDTTLPKLVRQYRRVLHSLLLNRHFEDHYLDIASSLSVLLCYSTLRWQFDKAENSALLELLMIKITHEIHKENSIKEHTHIKYFFKSLHNLFLGQLSHEDKTVFFSKKVLDGMVQIICFCSKQLRKMIFEANITKATFFLEIIYSISSYFLGLRKCSTSGLSISEYSIQLTQANEILKFLSRAYKTDKDGLAIYFESILESLSRVLGGETKRY